MNPFESYFKSHNHHRLYYQVWKPEKPKAVLIFVHGLNEHSGRYDYPVQYFFEHGFTLYLFDQQGHGRSDGLRSFVDDFESYLKDLHEFVKHIQNEEKKKKNFMIGHSMGGQIALNYVAKYPHDLDGLITSSANVQMALKVPWLKRVLGLSLAKYFPRFTLANEIDPKWISRDHEVVRAYKKDPLVSKKITLRLASEMIKNQEALFGLASKVKLPAFILHGGDDHICATEGSRQFFEKMGSKDKSFKIYDGFYHEIFNEFGKEEVFKDIERWVMGHL